MQLKQLKKKRRLRRKYKKRLKKRKSKRKQRRKHRKQLKKRKSKRKQRRKHRTQLKKLKNKPKQRRKAAKKAQEAAKTAKEKAEAAKKAEDAAKKAKEQAEAAKKAEEAAKKAKEQAEAAKKAEEAAKKAKEQAEAAKKAEEAAKKAEDEAVASLQYNLSQEAKKDAKLEVVYDEGVDRNRLKKGKDGKYTLSEDLSLYNEGEKVVIFDNDGRYRENTYIKGQEWGKIFGNALSYSQTMLFGGVGAYIGKATPAKDLDQLNGSATYVGKAYVTKYYPTEKIGHKYGAGDPGFYIGEDIVMNVDFGKKVINGKISTFENNNTEVFRKTKMIFKDAKIKQDNNEITFAGKAEVMSKDPSLKLSIEEGDYKGKFMGPNATELAGSAEFVNTQSIKSPKNFSKVYTIFNATKIPKKLKQEKEFTYIQEDGRKVVITPIYVDNNKYLASLFKKDTDGSLKGFSDFETRYSRIIRNGFVDGDGMLGYSGIPTSSKDMPNLKGQIMYSGESQVFGKRLIDRDTTLRGNKIYLNVDFDKKSIDGLIKSGSDISIVLAEGNINEKGGNIVFSGKATYVDSNDNDHDQYVDNNIDGNYDGKFMGPNAAELAGKAEFKVPEEQVNSQGYFKDYHTISAAFNASQVK